VHAMSLGVYARHHGKPLLQGDLMPERFTDLMAGRVEGEHLRERDLRERDLRERWADMQGSLNGLLEESQALAKRVDGLEERIWTRSSGAEEAARQSMRELQQHFQALERQNRLTSAAAEDAQRRQSSKQKRTDSLLEDFEWRISKVEEECRAGLAADSNICENSESFRELCSEVEALGTQVAALQSERGMPQVPQVSDEPAELPATLLEPLTSSLERSLAAFEVRTGQQLEELRTSLASVRVKVDGQLQRQNAIADRLETAHVPAIDAIREEFAEQRTRDLSSIEGWIATARQSVDLAAADTAALTERMDGIARRLSGSEATLRATRKESHNIRVALRAALSGRCGTVTGSGGSGGVGPGSLSLGSPLEAVPEQTVGLIGASAVPAIQEQLSAMADQLDTLDDVVGRVRALERCIARSSSGGGTATAAITAAAVAKATRCSVADLGSSAATAAGETLPASRPSSRADSVSCDVVVEDDESVASARELQRRCDTFEEVVPTPRSLTTAAASVIGATGAPAALRSRTFGLESGSSGSAGSARTHSEGLLSAAPSEPMYSDEDVPWG